MVSSDPDTDAKCIHLHREHKSSVLLYFMFSLLFCMKNQYHSKTGSVFHSRRLRVNDSVRWVKPNYYNNNLGSLFHSITTGSSVVGLRSHVTEMRPHMITCHRGGRRGWFLRWTISKCSTDHPGQTTRLLSNQHKCFGFSFELSVVSFWLFFCQR